MKNMLNPMSEESKDEMDKIFAGSLPKKRLTKEQLQSMDREDWKMVSRIMSFNPQYESSKSRLSDLEEKVALVYLRIALGFAVSSLVYILIKSFRHLLFQ